MSQSVLEAFCRSLDSYASTHTVANYRRDIQRFLRYLEEVAALPLASVSIVHCYDYMAVLNEQGVGARSVARHVASLRRFWGYLQDVKCVDENPWAAVKTPKGRRTLPTVLGVKEVLDFLDSFPLKTLPQLRDKAVCELMFSSGLRVSEAVGLNLEDVHFGQYELLVNGKGGRQRVALFSPAAEEWLLNYLSKVRSEWIGNRVQSALFLNSRGERLSVRAVQRAIETHTKRLGLSQVVTPHVLRHSFASALYNNGADLVGIQELLGHRHLSTTQIYTHVSNRKLQETYQKSHPRAG